ncbi:MAG TPA: VOC family protein [Dehalococcoidia bacterium]|nr:VOC family protein [Dehalococcoidia bacterium]
MKARELGHVVLYVRNLERSLRFYRDLLGFEVVGSVFGGKAAALTAGRTHHELLLIEVGEDATPIPEGRRVGLYHIGVKVGDGIEELREAYRQLVEAGVPIAGASDHTITKSIYVFDPDGHEVEVFTDEDPAIWRENPAAVLAPIRPLRL